MKNRFALITIILLTFAAAAPAQAAKDASELTRMLNEFLAGVSDPKVHDRFWADDLIYTRSAGVRINKAELMKGMNAPKPASKPDDPVTTFTAEDIRIQQYGNTAVVAFRLVSTNKKGTETTVANNLNTGTFVERGGKWQVVAWQSTIVPKTGGASAQVPPSASEKCPVQELAIDAALGDPVAIYDLAVEFHRGDAIPQDLAKAAALWRISVKAGDISSHNNLGHLTYYGRGVKADRAEGIRLWRIAAMKGFPESQIHMAYAYVDGEYLKTDYVEAYAWATAGKHFGELMEEPGDRKAMSEMADTVLKVINNHLTKASRAAANTRAALYIAKYAPKEEH